MANTKIGVKQKRAAEWALFYHRGYQYKNGSSINDVYGLYYILHTSFNE